MTKYNLNPCVIYTQWVSKLFIWGRKWQPTPVSLPGESHGPRSLVGYCLWGRKMSDTTEWLNSKLYISPNSSTSALSPLHLWFMMSLYGIWDVFSRVFVSLICLSLLWWFNLISVAFSSHVAYIWCPESLDLRNFAQWFP